MKGHSRSSRSDSAPTGRGGAPLPCPAGRADPWRLRLAAARLPSPTPRFCRWLYLHSSHLAGKQDIYTRIQPSSSLRISVHQGTAARMSPAGAGGDQPGVVTAATAIIAKPRLPSICSQSEQAIRRLPALGKPLQPAPASTCLSNTAAARPARPSTLCKRHSNVRSRLGCSVAVNRPPPPRGNSRPVRLRSPAALDCAAGCARLKRVLLGLPDGQGLLLAAARRLPLCRY